MRAGTRTARGPDRALGDRALGDRALGDRALGDRALGGRARTPPGGTPDDFASRVLDVAEAIPPGRVMSYGDIADYLGRGGPRQVGRVMALWGGGVAWWRVIHADGSLLAGHEREAAANYAGEGTPMRPAGDGHRSRVDMRLARWDGVS